METRREELIPQVYQCYIEEKDFSNKSNDPGCRQYLYKMKSTMKSEKKAVKVMNKKITDIGMPYREKFAFNSGMRDIRMMRRLKEAPVRQV